jgi:predicted GNAT family acetyltransferase
VDFDVVDNAEHNRFEIRVDGMLAGAAYYRLHPADAELSNAEVSNAEVSNAELSNVEPGRIVFTHTEVEKEFEGKGVGSKLANGALTLAKDRGLRIVAQCPFIAAYLKKHPELA